jgi:hypothetical protein
MVASGKSRRKVGWQLAGFIGSQRGQWPPARDGSRALPRLHIVDAREKLAQLDGSREFAALFVGSAGRGSLCLGDNEHHQSMRYADRRVQVLAVAVYRRIERAYATLRDG